MIFYNFFKVLDSKFKFEFNLDFEMERKRKRRTKTPKREENANLQENTNLQENAQQTNKNKSSISTPSDDEPPLEPGKKCYSHKCLQPTRKKPKKGPFSFPNFESEIVLKIFESVESDEAYKFQKAKREHREKMRLNSDMQREEASSSQEASTSQEASSSQKENVDPESAITKVYDE